MKTTSISTAQWKEFMKSTVSKPQRTVDNVFKMNTPEERENVFDEWLIFTLFELLKKNLVRSETFKFSLALAQEENLSPEKVATYSSALFQDYLSYSYTIAVHGDEFAADFETANEKMRDSQDKFIHWYTGLTAGISTHIFVSQPSGQVRLSNSFESWCEGYFEGAPRVKEWLYLFLDCLSAY